MRGVAALAAAIALGACARQVPPERPAAALYRDVERMVTIAETAGWGVHRLEVEGLLAEALGSVCLVEKAQREVTLAWVDARIVALGGPVEDAWRRAGKDLDAVDELLTLSRIRDVLAHAIAQADADCPFYVEPDPAFAGRQISDDRWQLTFGGGGKGIFVAQDGQYDLQAGGAGRMLIGRVYGSRHAMYLGGEAGASASFPRDETGDRSELIFAFDLVVPVVYRYSWVNTYAELEVGYLAHVTEEDLRRIDSGIHVGIAFGARATRTRFLFPGAAFGVQYERTFPDDSPGLTMVKVGLRVAFDWDL